MSAANPNCYHNLQANMPAIKELADAMLQAKFFGLVNKGAALVVAVELFVTGETPMEYQRRNGFVGGNPYIPYDAMIAAFQEDGGKVKLVEKSPDLASVELTYAGETNSFSLSWSEAQKETFVYDGKAKDVIQKLESGSKPKLKSKYATPRSRAIMLYARCIDDGIRSIASGVNFGRYTAEIVEDLESDREAVTVQAVESDSVQPAETPVQQAPTPSQADSSGETHQQPAPDSSSTATADNQAQQPREDRSPQPSETETSSPGSDAISGSIHDPCGDLRRNQILDLISQFAQQGMPEIKDQIVARLRAAGLGGLAELTVAEADGLINALKVKRIETWIESEISGAAKRSQEAESGNEQTQA